MVAGTGVPSQPAAPDEAIPRLAAACVPSLALELQAIRQPRRSQAQVEIGRHEHIVRIRAERRDCSADERSNLQSDRHVLNSSQRVEASRAHESNSTQSDERIDSRGLRLHKASRKRGRRVGVKSGFGETHRRGIRPRALVRERDSEKAESPRRTQPRDASRFCVFPSIAECQSPAIPLRELRMSPALADERPPRETLQVRPKWKRHLGMIVPAERITQ